MKYMFVVESPSKINKIQGFLGDDYLVTASKGHIRTLGEEKNIGIDIENEFQPEFHIDPKKLDVVAKLRSEAGKCDTPIYLATDMDREGEAISWHIREVLELSPEQVKRVVFTEITKKAVIDALANPKDLDMNMVNSQLARQILDKLIGFKVSPCLWKEFKNWKLSAGRVQSVVTKLIIEREQEISKFASSNYFKVSAGFNLDNSEKSMTAKKSDLTTELDARITDVNEVSNIIANTDSGTATYWIDVVTKTKSKRQPSAPFITSSLQQEASNKLGMSPDETMSCAQKLYEAGLITYMRTDSLMLSEESLGKIGAHIQAIYGDGYHRKQQYTKKAKGAQEAHEAIRPTDVSKRDVSTVSGIKPREAKLYGLIWKRTVASQMSPADVEIKTVKVRLDHSVCVPKLDPAKHNTGQPYTFVTKHEKILFDGFMKLYSKPSEAVEGNPEENDEGGDGDASGTGQTLNATESKRLETLFDSLKKGQQVWCGFLAADEKQTKPPNGRYTEASLVKKLEDLGIGRPSTYASMVSKVQEKSYIEKRDIPAKDKEFRSLGFKYPNDLVITSKTVKVDGEKNKLIPSSLGIMITGFLIKNFELFMDYDFTANVELLLDNIAEGTKPWQGIVRGVWDYLNPIISRIETNSLIPALSDSVDGNCNLKSRSLGINPDTGNEILVKRMRTGWSIIENNIRDTKKSKFAALGLYNPESITLAEALPLLIWPKQLGYYEDEPVILNKKTNIYITYDGKHYSIENYINAPTNKGNHTITDQEAIDLATAITIINYFKTQTAGGQQASTDIKFDGVDDYVIKQGPYGYYIKYLNMYNIPLPANVKKNISLATKENCDVIIKNYLSNKGQSTSLNDIKIKPAAEKKTIASTGKAKNTTKKAASTDTTEQQTSASAPKVKTQRKQKSLSAVSEPIANVTITESTPEKKPRAPRKKKE